MRKLLLTGGDIRFLTFRGCLDQTQWKERWWHLRSELQPLVHIFRRLPESRQRRWVRFTNTAIFELAESVIFQQRIIQSRRSLILRRQKVRLLLMCCVHALFIFRLSFHPSFPGCLSSLALRSAIREVGPLVLPARRTNPGEINHQYGPTYGRRQGGGNRLVCSSWSASKC